MSEYAIYQGRPVKKTRFAAGSQEVRLADGNLIFAKDLTEISKEEYERLVKEERDEWERLGRKKGLGSCEFLALKRHGTGAAQTRG